MRGAEGGTPGHLRPGTRRPLQRQAMFPFPIRSSGKRERAAPVGCGATRGRSLATIRGWLARSVDLEEPEAEPHRRTSELP